MKVEELPSKSTCIDAVETGKATTLQKFMYNFEPKDKTSSRMFRQQLIESFKPQLDEASDYDKLYNKVSEFYDESNDKYKRCGDLCQIGEVVAIHLGFLV